MRFNLLNFFDLSLPWDQTTLSGYFPTIAYATLFSAAYFILNAIFLAAFVVICLQFDSLRIHYDNIISELNNLNKMADNHNAKIQKILSTAVEFHILMKK